MTRRRTVTGALLAGALYACLDGPLVFVVGLSSLLHSVAIGAVAAALIGSRTPLPLKFAGLAVLLIAFMMPPFVADNLWSLWQAQIRDGGELGLFYHLGRYTGLFFGRAALFVLISIIVAIAIHRPWESRRHE